MSETALEKLVRLSDAGEVETIVGLAGLTSGWSDTARLHAMEARKLHRADGSHRLGLEGEGVAREMHAKATSQMLAREAKAGPLGKTASAYQASHSTRMAAHADSLKQLKKDLRASNRQYAVDTKPTDTMPYPQIGGHLGPDTPEKAAARGAVNKIVDTSMKKFHAAQKAAEEQHALRLRAADTAHDKRVGKILADDRRAQAASAPGPESDASIARQNAIIKELNAQPQVLNKNPPIPRGPLPPARPLSEADLARQNAIVARAARGGK